MSRRPKVFANWPETLVPSYGPYRGIVEWHIDGDTYDVFMDLGINIYIYLVVRLLGVDTPETNRGSTRLAGLAATEYVRSIMPEGSPVLLKTRKTDSFGRYLAEITLVDGHSLSVLIIDAGFGVAA